MSAYYHRPAGYGCAGVAEGVVLYREHEDEFPVCERIEPQ